MARLEKIPSIFPRSSSFILSVLCLPQFNHLCYFLMYWYSPTSPNGHSKIPAKAPYIFLTKKTHCNTNTSLYRRRQPQIATFICVIPGLYKKDTALNTDTLVCPLGDRIREVRLYLFSVFLS